MESKELKDELDSQAATARATASGRFTSSINYLLGENQGDLSNDHDV